MIDDRSERLSQLQLKLSQFVLEHQHAIGGHREDLSALKETQRLALRVVMWASIPAFVWIVAWSAIVFAGESTFHQIELACFLLVPLACLSAAAARGSGLAAYWWFNRTNVSQRMATVVISLLAAGTVFGWVIAATYWMQSGSV